MSHGNVIALLQKFEASKCQTDHHNHPSINGETKVGSPGGLGLVTPRHRRDSCPVVKSAVINWSTPDIAAQRVYLVEQSLVAIDTLACSTFSVFSFMHSGSGFRTRQEDLLYLTNWRPRSLSWLPHVRYLIAGRLSCCACSWKRLHVAQSSIKQKGKFSLAGIKAEMMNSIFVIPPKCLRHAVMLFNQQQMRTFSFPRNLFHT